MHLRNDAIGYVEQQTKSREAAKCCTTCTEFPNTVGKSSAVFTEEQDEARVTCDGKQEPALWLGHSSSALL